MEHQLTSEQAFIAMKCFLKKYYIRTNSDDIGSLLGDLEFFDDQLPADRAAWNDWLECVHQILGK